MCFSPRSSPAITHERPRHWPLDLTLRSLRSGTVSRPSPPSPPSQEHNGGRAGAMDAATASVQRHHQRGSRPARSGGHLPKRASISREEAHRRRGRKGGERSPFTAAPHAHRRWVGLMQQASLTLRIDAVETVDSRGWTKCPSRRVAPSRTFCPFSQTQPFTASPGRCSPSVSAAEHSRLSIHDLWGKPSISGSEALPFWGPNTTRGRSHARSVGSRRAQLPQSHRRTGADDIRGLPVRGGPDRTERVWHPWM